MKQKRPSRLTMPAISEEMKAWSAALAGGIADWPHASTRWFFGFTALYRREKVIGLAPHPR